MKTFRQQADRRQIALIPASIDDYIPSDDIVRFIDAMIDEMDLEEIETKYSSFGRPAYHPAVLVKIILYGKMRGIRSSRELSRASRENLRFMFLSNNEKPDFRTILLFRKRFHRELGGLLKQTIGIGLKEKLITLDHVSIDGTKLRAFASRNSFKTPANLERDLQELEEEIANSMQEDIKIDHKENRRYGNKDKEETLPKNLKNKKELVGKIKSALQQYKKKRQSPPKRVSTTDAECRYMKGKGILPSYNAQVAVDRVSHMVVGGLMTNDCTDHGQLRPMLAEIEKQTGKNPKVVTVDRGYGEIAGLVDLEKRSIDGYVPQSAPEKNRFTLEVFEYDKQTDSYRCPADQVLTLQYTGKRHKVYTTTRCEACPLRGDCLRDANKGKNRLLSVSRHQALVSAMKKKTETKKGKAMAKIRGATVEHVFGYIKYSKKLHQIFYRGLQKVNSMWKIELTAYNIEKLARHHQKQALLAAT